MGGRRNLRCARFEVRCTPGEKRLWRRAARGEETTVTGLLTRLMLDFIARQAAKRGKRLEKEALKAANGALRAPRRFE